MAFSPSKMSRAKDILQAYNANVAEDLRFPIDELETRLNQFGAATDEDLELLSWEQLQEIGIPKLLAIRIAREIFRSQEQMQAVPPPVGAQQVVMVTMADQAGMLSNEALIQQFAANPGMRFSAVADQIRARSGNRKCIAYLPDGNVNVEASVKVLDGIMIGDEYGDSMRMPDGSVEYLYTIDERPDNIRDEHPVYAGQVLRADGTDRHGVFWGNISLECRQLIRFARQSGELKIRDRDGLLDLVDRTKQGMSSLAGRYPAAHRLYKDAKELGNLPSLRIRAAAVMQSPHSDDVAA